MAERRWSLSIAVPAAVLFAGALSVAGFTWHSVSHSLRSMEAGEMRLLRITGLNAAAALEAALRRGDPAEARRTVERANANRRLTWALYVDHGNRVVFANQLDLDGKLLADTRLAELGPEVARAQRKVTSTVGLEIDHCGAKGFFHVAAGVADAGGSGTRTGVYAVRIDLTTPRAIVIHEAVRQSVIGGILLVGLSLGLWFVLRRILLKRIARVHDFSAAFEQTGEPREIQVTGNDEIARLARRLERMAASLSERSRLLRESQKMEAVGRLAGGVAHDFNNYLTAILGNVSFALGSTAAASDEQLRTLLSEIEHAGTSAARLTRQLLTFGRKQSATCEPVDLVAVIHEMSGLLDRMIGPSHVVEQDLEPGCFVMGDRVQLEQVVLNLVVNAADAMPNGGPVRLACRSETAATAGSTPDVLLDVRDSGAGIREQDRERIFEPFFTTKALGSGTGLGLATVFMIVQDSHGHITVDSEVGVGTTFRIRLPGTGQRPPVSPDTSAQSAGRLTRGRVAVCDDHPAVRRVIAEMLERAGFEVTEFGRGFEVIHHLERAAVDVLVTDVLMPELSGIELARSIHANHPSVGFVFVSGFTSEIDSQSLAAFPGSTFLSKPVREEDLIAAVAACCTAHA